MRNILFYFLLFSLLIGLSTSSSFAQPSSLKQTDSIPIYNFIDKKIYACYTNLCKVLEVENVKIKAIKLRNFPFEKIQTTKDGIFHINRLNFYDHEVTEDTFIYQFSNTLLSSYKKGLNYEKKTIIKNFIFDHSLHIKDAMALLKEFKFYSFTPEDRLKSRQRIENIKDYKVISLLIKVIDYDIERNALNEKEFIDGLLQNRKILVDRLSYLVGKSRINYSSSLSKPKLLKGAVVKHDNDVFFWGLNEDKYYTGGGGVEILTDYLRFNIIRNLFANKHSTTLSYQTFFFGVEAFTPYIRFYSEYPDSLIREQKRAISYADDRPFASYEYIGISGHNLYYSGKWKSAYTFKVGRIGGKRSEAVQSTLHRDQTIASEKVIGWEDQIANGGRFALNLDLSVKYGFGNHLIGKMNDRKKVYMMGLMNTHLGNYLTAFDLGIQFSDRSMLELDDTHNFLLRPEKNHGFNVNLKMYLRRVIHNSSLSGFGVWKDTENQDLSEAFSQSERKLLHEEVKKYVGLFELGFGFRRNNMTLFYDLIYHTKETKLSSATPYGWGRVGLTFTVD